MNNQNNIWLIPCSPRHFDAEGCFNRYGEIFWKQENNFKNAKVGDTGYIYCSDPIKAICYSFEITETELPYSQIMDRENEFTLGGETNRDNSGCKFLVVSITGKTSSPHLTFDLLLLNGLKGSIMGAMKLSQKKYEDLFLYIEDHF